MYWKDPQRKQLLRLALITSPLMGIFRMAPVAILNQSLFMELLPKHLSTSAGLMLGVIFVSINVFILWLINIWLFTKKEWRSKDGNISNNLWKPILFSYLITLILLFIPPLLRLLLGIEPRQPSPRLTVYPLLSTLANNTIILLILNLVITRKNKAQLELKNMQLEMSNLIARQEQLKHQLNPHFLFNALFTLQLLINKKPQQATQYLKRLSTFLRASLQYAKSDKIALKEELAFCEDYLALQQVRFDKALEYHINIPEAIIQSSAVPVFSLQLLAENAIKHNGFNVKHPLQLSIEAVEDGFICVKNNIIPKYQESPSTGVGLKNLCERFKLMAEVEPRIEKAAEEGKYFIVHIPLLSL